ncbi:hypothetical protein OAG71_04795 [bacterium]|nr:hypothetical protein [bacterium]
MAKPLDVLTRGKPRYRRYRDLWMVPSSTSADLRPQLGAAVATATNDDSIRRYAKSRSSYNAIDKPTLRSTRFLILAAIAAAAPSCGRQPADVLSRSTASRDSDDRWASWRNDWII